MKPEETTKSSSASPITTSPFTIVWQNLTHTVKQSRWSIKSGQDQKSLGDKAKASNRRTVLDSICGHAKSGELTAILGPSGSGKSTLLKCLFQGKSANTSGQILVEGKSSVDKLKVCFIPQNDTLNEWLTVREDLRFVSRLKRTTFDSMSSAEAKRMQLYGFDELTLPIDHNRNACQAAEMVGITNCLDVLIKDISGGEKKRLSLARELMSRPDVLVLDEPTTGLDSLSCNKVVVNLKKLIRSSPKPLAVIITIHQPDKSVFNMLDLAYILSNSGQVIFNDNPRKSSEVTKTIARLDSELVIMNPSSLLMKIASDVDYQQAKLSLVHYYKSSYIERNTKVSHREEFVCDGQLQNSKRAREEYLWNFCILLHRNWLMIIRNTNLLKARLVFHLSFPMFLLFVGQASLSSVHGCPKMETEFDVNQMRRDVSSSKLEESIADFRQSLDNCAYFMVLLYGLGVNAMSLSASIYPHRIGMLHKESRNGLYSSQSYHMAQSVAELPFELLFPFISAMLTFYTSGQTLSPYCWRMFALGINVILFNYTCHSIGTLCGLVWSHNMGLAMLIAQSILLQSMNLSGGVILIKRMPPIIRWMSYYTFLQRAFIANVASIYGFNFCNCTEDMFDKSNQGFLSPRLRRVLEYQYPWPPTDNSSAEQGDLDFPVADLFDKLTDQYNKAQTFGLNMTSCLDVKPRAMHYFTVDDVDLFASYAIHGIMILLFQSLVYLKLRNFSYKKSV